MADKHHIGEKTEDIPFMTRARYKAEYAAFLAFRRLVLALPDGASRKSARFAAKLAWRFDKRHRRISLYNVGAAFAGEKSLEQIRRIALDNFIHIAETGVDALRSAHTNNGDFQSIFTFEGEEIMERELEKSREAGKAVICLSAHLGSQEMLVGHLIKFGRGKENIVTKRIKNPYIDNYVRSHRERWGVRVIPHRNSSREILKRVRAGELIVFLLDQRASFHEGVSARFFGRPVTAHRAAAQLALRYDLPVIPMFAIKKDDGRYCITYEAPLDLPKTGDIKKDTRAAAQLFQDVIERKVREYPEQWWWAHERWKRGEEMRDE